MARVLDLCAERLPRELPDSLDQPKRATGRTSLADRQLAARGVERKAAVRLERMAADEIRSFALAAKPRSSIWNTQTTG